MEAAPISAEPILLLEDDVINKIAAGEVVDRPASALKELLENSIDAGATNLSIELEDGGQRSISVRDDGVGIAAEQLPLAVRRHATSKINSVEALYHLSSLGFRGEALAAISSVSRFTIVSRLRGSSTAYSLGTNGDTGSTPQAAGAPEGTTVTIRDLFFNTPARRKFMRTSSTEYAHCLEVIQAVALANPQVGISLTHNKKLKLQMPPSLADWTNTREQGGKAVDQLKIRIASLFKDDASAAAIPFTAHNTFGSVFGLCSPPGLEKATGKQILTFVNKRWVRNKSLRYGIQRGYHSHLPKGRFPQVFLFLSTDPSLVDVNVHPAKTEVKFQYDGEIQSLIGSSLREVLRAGAWASGTQESEAQAQFESPPARRVFSERAPSAISDHSSRPAPQNSANFSQESPIRRPIPSSSSTLGLEMPSSVKRTDPAPFFESPSTATTFTPSRSPGPADKTESVFSWDNANFLGTFAKCYLLFEIHDRLLAVDQHAFHERIIYERIITNPKMLRESQRLLVPESFGLTPSTVSELAAAQHALSAIGFGVKIVDDQTVELEAIPSILVGRPLEELFSRIVELGADIFENASQELAHDCVATIACHSAVRSGEVLDPEQLDALISEARSVDFYHNCPHGRRVFRWFSKREVEGWFDRN